jgi:hypothetical protein
MNIVKNTLAVILGIVIGSIVNMSLINISNSVIPPPDGVDVKTLEGLKAGIHLFEPKHFIMPFLAHAIGTFAGALIALKIAASHQIKFAWSIGFFFLFGGTVNIFMLPSPLWFNITDLLLAYIPMTYLAIKLGYSNGSKTE